MAKKTKAKALHVEPSMVNPAPTPAEVLKSSQMDTIVEDIGKGIPLAEICRRENMPCLRSVYDWMDANAAFAARIARARVAGYDMIAQDALRIADTPLEGTRTKVGKDGVEVVTEDMLGHRKLQVETRLKLLAKWDPKRYGEKIAVEGGDGPPIQHNHSGEVTISPADLYRQLKGGE